MKLKLPKIKVRPPKMPTTTQIILALMPSLIAVAIGLLIGAIVILLAGKDPIAAYQSVFIGSLGSPRAIAQVLQRSTPIILISAGLVIAYTCRCYNIGVDGQATMGGLAAAWLGPLLGNILPSLALLPLIGIAGFAAGAFLALISAILYTKWNINLVITTIMLSTVAVFFGQWVTRYPLEDPNVHGMGNSSPMPLSARLPVLVPATKLHIGIIVAIIVSLVFWYLKYKTTFGYQLRLIGNSKEAAHYAGVNTSRVIIIAMLISGGICGLAGVLEVTGYFYYMGWNLLIYMSLAVGATFLGKVNPAGTILGSLLYGVLIVGGLNSQRIWGLPFTIVDIISSVIFAVALCTGQTRRLTLTLIRLFRKEVNS